MSDSAISEFEIVQGKLPRDQISDYLREQIYNGNLEPGVRLPTTKKMAVQWKTHMMTIQRAIVPLVKEGLLVRMPGVGTFVRKRQRKLACIGVYNGTSLKEGPYAHAVQEALRDELYKAGIEMDLWIDPQPLKQHRKSRQAMLKAAKNWRFQAFIGIGLNMADIKWQEKLPVPVAFLGAPPPFRNDVQSDTRQFVELSLKELARQGCRSVGMILPILRCDNPARSNPQAYEIIEHFVDMAADLGLTVKNEWMHLQHKHSIAPAQDQEEFGYEEFLRLWSLPEKPDGLIVFPDVAARGVILALREKQVRVPEELRLVFSKNESVNLFCPMPATFMVNSERETARALIEQVQKQFRGETCKRIVLPFKRVPHDYSPKGRKASKKAIR